MVSRVHRYPLLEDQPWSTELPPPKLLFLGTCAVAPLLFGLRGQGLHCDHLIWESTSYAPVPDFDTGQYDAVVASLTMGHIFADAAQAVEPDQPYGNTIYWPRIVGAEQAYFDACVHFINDRVDAMAQQCRDKPIFYMSFLEPKHNYMGSLLKRYSLSNPVYFVDKLNEALEAAFAPYANAYMIDMNELMGLVGRISLQDDYITSIAHGTIIDDDIWDAERIQTSTQPRTLYDTVTVRPLFEEVVARRLLDNLAILRKPLEIKAIIVDFDDTLWRGIAAEDLAKPHWEFTEGWPLGVAEALLIFKARGGMIAACSKNDEMTIRNRWHHLYGSKLRFDDFASIKINFERKSDNIRDILSELNILPANVLFIDDNPREIDEVRTAFPDMKFLSEEHYDWRRKILMSPATQVAAINSDAALRTASIQANAVRSLAQVGKTKEEWLASLELVQNLKWITSPDDEHFPRAFELLNKTNQFNTTGKRWERADLEMLLKKRGVLLCSFLKDRLADNGMISVFVLKGNRIDQAVLSCRAFNYGVEFAALHAACTHILQNNDEVQAKLADTGLNASCHQFFAKAGFVKHERRWVTTTAPPVPAHLTVRDMGSELAPAV